MTRSESESQVRQRQKEPLRHLEVRQQNPLPDPCSKSGLQRPPGNTLTPAGCTTVPAILQEGDPAVVISFEFPLGSPALLRTSQFTDRLLRPRELRHLAKVTIRDPDPNSEIFRPSCCSTTCVTSDSQVLFVKPTFILKRDDNTYCKAQSGGFM